MHDANDLGVMYFRRGDWANAIRYFQEALVDFPYDPTILENLGVARERQAQAQAEAEAEEERRRQAQAQAEAEAEEERRRQAQAQAEAEAEEERRRQAQAEAEAEAEEERRRQAEAEAEAEAWELGRVMLYEGRWADAEYYLREYLRANPGDPWSHSRLGYALLKQGRYAEAVEANRQAVKLAPNEAAFRGDLVLSLDRYAWTLAVKGKVAEARGLYSEAVDVAQGHPEFKSKLEALLNETYQAAASLPNGAAVREMAARALVRLDPASVYNQVLLGETLFVNGDPDGAKAAYGEAIRLRPDDQELYSHVAKRLVEIGDPKAAHDLLTKALQAAPNDANLHIQMGNYYQWMGQPEAAEREFALARQLAAATDQGADEPDAVFGADEPDAVFGSDEPYAIGQACGIAGVSSSECPKPLELQGMDVQTRFNRQVESIPQAARIPEIVAVIEEGQKITRRIDENKKRLEEARLTLSNTAEISRLENEIRNDKEELKEKEKEIASFSLQAKLNQGNAELAKDKEADPDVESGGPAAADIKAFHGETAATDN